MCGRFTFGGDAREIRDWLDSDDDQAVQPSFNFAPTELVPVIRADAEGNRHLVQMHWGLIPSWAKDRKLASKMINARADTIAVKPAYRAAYKRRRCLVPMSGYIEWKTTAEGKVPHYVQGEGPIAAAAVWEKWTDPATHALVESCSIITTESAPSLRALHERMPVIIAPSQHRIWLGSSTPIEVVSQLLLPFDGLAFRPISKRVNNPRNKGADVLHPE